MSLRPARRRWWRTRIDSGGRQASLCKHVRLVEEKQLVIHLQTRCQKTDIGPMMDGGGFHTADQYRVNYCDLFFFSFFLFFFFSFSFFSFLNQVRLFY